MAKKDKNQKRERSVLSKGKSVLAWLAKTMAFMKRIKAHLAFRKKKDKNVPIIKPIFEPDSVKANFAYIDTLKDFLLHKPVTNIALEGDFATGKSSVLYGLLKDRKIDKKKPKIISSLTLPDESVVNKEAEDKRKSRIQKTIPRICPQ